MKQIHKQHLEKIQNALRLVTNYRSKLGNKETCMDREVQRAYDIVQNVIKSDSDISPIMISLPHESQIEASIDKLLIIRGEHPSRVRHPIYSEERKLATDLIKYILLGNES